MAIDTAQKRYSAILMSLVWRGPSVIPTGTIDQSERQAAGFMYSGIAAGGAPPPPPPSVGSEFIIRMRRRRR